MELVEFQHFTNLKLMDLDLNLYFDLYLQGILICSFIHFHRIFQSSLYLHTVRQKDQSYIMLNIYKVKGDILTNMSFHHTSYMT